MPNNRTDRRRFMQASAATGIGFWVAGGVQAQDSKSPNEDVAIACIGVGGKGSSDADDAGKQGRIVAVCDVDDATLNAGAMRAEAAEADKGRKTKVARYKDFRKMLDEMGGSIDAVTVSTPDHTHAPAALMAMRMGKHCFCQKPLTHTIYEARLMAKVASEKKVATQMGNQWTAWPALRKAAEFIKSGALGAIKEVHVLTDRPVWPQGANRPKSAACPGVDWNLWLGPAPVRPSAMRGPYHPFKWRGWWDFGTGALGDMACHTVNMPYMALDLRDPLAVQATCSGHNGDSYPASSRIDFDFGPRGNRPGLKLLWYDGKESPSEEMMAEPKRIYKAEIEDYKKRKKGNFLGSLCIVVGEKDTLYAPGDYAERPQRLADGRLVPEDIKYTESPGHFAEWIRAIKGGEPATSNFPKYAGGLTETILLGNLAVWTAASGKGPRVEWDAENMRSTNIAGLETIIKPIYRPGYTLDV